MESKQVKPIIYFDLPLDCSESVTLIVDNEGRTIKRLKVEVANLLGEFNHQLELLRS